MNKYCNYIMRVRVKIVPGCPSTLESMFKIEKGMVLFVISINRYNSNSTQLYVMNGNGELAFIELLKEYYRSRTFADYFEILPLEETGESVQ